MVQRILRPPLARPAMFHNRGVALVIVLWMLALLTTIAHSMTTSLRAEVQASMQQVAVAEAEAAADSGVFVGLQHLAAPATTEGRWQDDGVPHEIAVGNAIVVVTIVNEASRIDLNTAPESLLADLFRSIGLDDETALRLSATIADWRDTDDLPRPAGAEKAEYAAAGNPFAPGNAKFGSIDELRSVAGVSEEIFRRVAPFVTVYSGSAAIDATTAPLEVLAALPGASRDWAQSYIDLRRQALADGQPVPPVPAHIGGAGKRLSDTFTIQVDVKLGENARFAREAVVRTTPNAKKPAIILSWRSPERELNPAPDAHRTPKP